jgi:hypothetical protein
MENTNLSQPSLGQSTALGVPVAFIIFRRPDTTRRVFEEIRQAQPRKLYVIADGARQHIHGEQELVESTRNILDLIDWPCEVVRIYANENLGLRQRVISGLDEVFSREDRAIILEDDCLPSRSFFSFTTELLEKYESDERIALVSGFNFAPSRKLDSDYFFSHSTYIWGWATWSRTWRAFRASPQVEKWSEDEIKEIQPTFASRMQKRDFLNLMAIANTLDTWDVSLAVWIRQVKLLTVIPRINLIENIGFGVEATHTKFEAFDVQIKSTNFDKTLEHPRTVVHNSDLEKRMWFAKSLRWLTFPTQHPIQFVRRFLAYLRIRHLHL